MKGLGGCIGVLFVFAFVVFTVISFFIIITEAIGKFLFNLFGLEYSSFSIWLLLIFGSLSIIFFYASKESYRDYVVKLKVYKMFQKILGDD
ncbi:MAG: hypothetical protein ACYDA4_15280 [Ignavibacteriaceae bacterium]